MKTRKYSEASVAHEIYCSSSYDHFISVVYRVDGSWQSRDFWIEQDSLLNTRGNYFEVPVYFRHEILKALLKAVKDGVRFYEFDRDGNKRYENLRYHDTEEFERLIHKLEGYLKAGV